MGIASESTSPTLMERLRNPDDKEAWEAFCAIYTRAIMTWLSLRGVPDEDLQDVTQEIMLRVYLEFRDGKFIYDANQSFRKWLKTVCCNAAIDFLRKRNRHPLIVGIQEDLACDGPSCFLESPEFDTICWMDALNYLKRMGKVIEIHAEAFLAVHKGCSLSEVAENLGMTIEAIKMANIRTTRKLNEFLRLPGEGDESEFRKK